MFAGIALLPLAVIYPVLIVGVGLVAGASGLLIPAFAYLVSLSAVAAWLFAVLIGRSFWVTAALLVLGAATAHHVAAAWKEVGNGPG